MSGHFELGEIIKNHRDTDVGESNVPCEHSLCVCVCVC